MKRMRFLIQQGFIVSYYAFIFVAIVAMITSIITFIGMSFATAIAFSFATMFAGLAAMFSYLSYQADQ